METRARTRAGDPSVVVHDVDLARSVVEAEEHAGQDRDGVFLVVDVRDGGDGGVGVEVVREGLVADLTEMKNSDQEAVDAMTFKWRH